MPSVFTKIRNRELPAKIFYEDDDVIVIADHRPKDKVHLLIIPRVEVRNFYEATPDILDLLNRTAKLVAEKLDLSTHFRIIINNGYCQEVDHIHYHFLSNRGKEWVKYLEE